MDFNTGVKCGVMVAADLSVTYMCHRFFSVKGAGSFGNLVGQYPLPARLALPIVASVASNYLINRYWPVDGSPTNPAHDRTQNAIAYYQRRIERHEKEISWMEWKAFASDLLHLRNPWSRSNTPEKKAWNDESRVSRREVHETMPQLDFWENYGAALSKLGIGAMGIGMAVIGSLYFGS